MDIDEPQYSLDVPLELLKRVEIAAGDKKPRYSAQLFQAVPSLFLCLNDEVADWLDKNVKLKSRRKITFSTNHLIASKDFFKSVVVYKITFYNERDATLFKLFWL